MYGKRLPYTPFLFHRKEYEEEIIMSKLVLSSVTPENVNTLWILLAAALVFFMQAGFAMVETGFTRAKNAGNIIMKNLMDFCLGAPIFWFIGYGIMFAGTGKFIGGLDLFTNAGGDYATLIFQTVFCATAATIVSGAMAERTKFKSYLVYSMIISAIVYPISGHWIWGGGWLSQLGFHDFAGSTAVHMVGGISALIGAKILGPRIGKYDKNGKPRAIPGHSITLGALGVFILWFCWFGFNGGSTVAMVDGADVLASKVFVTTNLAAACATIATMCFTWIRYKKPDVSMTLNGSLAGLVAITAGCDVVEPWAAAVIGVIAGIAVVLAVEFFDKIVKIDDPVGAIAVHGCCGALGTLLTGIFANDVGIIYGGGFNFFLIQLLGILSVIAWVVLTMTFFFLLIKKTIGLRASTEEEVLGLDITEHGLASAYADFSSTVEEIYLDNPIATEIIGNVPMSAAVPVELKESAPVASDTTVKFTKVEIVCKQSRFDLLKTAMNNIGITGMTVTHVLGYGVQRGKPEYYRGAEIENNLLPKVQVEIVVCKVPVKTVIETAKRVLYTGHIGDGKIFVSNIENVIKVRTGEEGCDALQDVE